MEFTTVHGINQALSALGTRIKFFIVKSLLQDIAFYIIKSCQVSVRRRTIRIYILYKLNAITNAVSIIFLAIYFKFFKLSFKCPVYQTKERFHAK